MDKTRRKEIVQDICIILAVIYLPWLLYSSVLAFKMQTLTYQSMGWGAVWMEYQLNFADDLAEMNSYNSDRTLANHEEKVFSVVQQAKVKLVCAISLMPLWRKNYCDSKIQDGDQWQTIVTYRNKEKTTYGSNAYPLTYRLVHHAILSVF